MIACPGGDFCSLANARSLPIAAAITQRYQDLDEEHDLGEIDLNISGCINSCGHHHAGHIGILGVDKDGREWYQVTVGGADGSDLSGRATPGKVLGPSFSAAEVPEVVEALLDTYRRERIVADGRPETFIATVRRIGVEPFKAAAHAARLPEREAASSRRTLKILTAHEYAGMGAQPNVLRIANDRDVEDMALDGSQVIELEFPKFTDRRAYSQAYALRRRGFAARSGPWAPCWSTSWC